jgi:hypothetical protein
MQREEWGKTSTRDKPRATPRFCRDGEALPFRRPIRLDSQLGPEDDKTPNFRFGVDLTVRQVRRE